MITKWFIVNVRRFQLLVLVLLIIFRANSQPPKYSNEFLAIGVGARPLSMANSIVAGVNDVTAGYWNPAGLAFLSRDIEIGLMHAEYFAQIAKFDYLAAAMRLDTSSGFAASIVRFGVDDIPNTLDLYDENGDINYNRITKFSVADYAVLLSYARKPSVKGLSIGGNVKIIRRVIGEFAQSWGFGFDVGAQYRYKNWLFGAAGRDVTSTFNAWSFNNELLEEPFALTGNEMPQNSFEITLPRLISGVAYDARLFKHFSMLTEIDADITFDGKRHELIKSNFASISPHMGIQFNYDDIVFVRGGIGNIQQAMGYDGEYYSFQPNIGLGIRFLAFHLDYALTDIGDKSLALYSHIFSLNIAFNR